MNIEVIKAIKSHCKNLLDWKVGTEDDINEVLCQLETPHQNDKQRELLTKKQVAELAKVNPRTVDRWADGGKLTKRIIGNNSCRFDSEEVERFLFG